MKVLRAAAMIALLAGPAYAQSDPSIQRAGEPDKEKTFNELQGEKAAKKAYEQSLGNIPDKGPTDPWGSARSIDAPKAATKTVTKAAPAKPKTKPGSAAN